MNIDRRVYFAQATWGGPIKIGNSGDTKRRIHTLQGPLPFDLVEIGSFPGAMFQEMFLHSWFNEHRVRGEWFAPVPELWRAALECRTHGELDWVPRAQIRVCNYRYSDFPGLLKRYHIRPSTLSRAIGIDLPTVELYMRRNSAAPTRWLAALCACVRKHHGTVVDIDVTNQPTGGIIRLERDVAPLVEGEAA